MKYNNVFLPKTSNLQHRFRDGAQNVMHPSDIGLFRTLIMMNDDVSRVVDRETDDHQSRHQCDRVPIRAQMTANTEGHCGNWMLLT